MYTAARWRTQLWYSFVRQRRTIWLVRVGCEQWIVFDRDLNSPTTSRAEQMDTRSLDAQVSTIEPQYTRSLEGYGIHLIFQSG